MNGMDSSGGLATTGETDCGEGVIGIATDSPFDNKPGKLTSIAETGPVVLKAGMKGLKSRVSVRQMIVNGGNLTFFLFLYASALPLPVFGLPEVFLFRFFLLVMLWPFAFHFPS